MVMDYDEAAKQRHKPLLLIRKELDRMGEPRACVFLADDNTVNLNAGKAVL